jgi:hypothetical protein
VRRRRPRPQSQWVRSGAPSASSGPRLVQLERQLPADGTDSPIWREYVATASAYARVRELLYGRRRPPAACTPIPAVASRDIGPDLRPLDRLDLLREVEGDLQLAVGGRCAGIPRFSDTDYVRLDGPLTSWSTALRGHARRLGSLGQHLVPDLPRSGTSWDCPSLRAERFCGPLDRAGECSKQRSAHADHHGSPRPALHGAYAR